MANTTFNTRIRLKYDTLTNWVNANPVLLEGEIAVVVVPAAAGAVVQEPAVLFKVGDGTSTFSSLGWVSGIAADVHDWAKAAEKPTYAATEITGIGSYIADYVDKELGISVDTNTQYQVVATEDGMGFTLQSKDKGTDAWSDVKTINFSAKFVKAITTGSANGTISIDGVDVAVKGLGSAAYTNASAYDAAGTANTALTEAKTYADGLKTAVDADVDAVEADLATVTAKITTLIGDDADKSVRTIANEELAKQLIAEGADEKLDTLQEIAAWIQSHPGDAAAMNQAITDLEGLVGDTAVATQIANAIAALDLANTYEAKGAANTALTEAKAYADGLDSAMDERVAALEGKFTGDGSVADQISTAVAAETAAREAAVKEVQDDVDAIAADYLTSTDKTELNGKITTAQSAAEAAQAHSEGVATDLATEVAAREALATTVAGHTSGIADIVAKNNSQQSEIDALEGLVGDTKVSDQIDAKITALDLANTYATKIEHNALAERATTLEGEMDAVEARATNLETEVAKKANTNDLHAVAFSGKITDLENGDSYVVLNCGSSTVNV